MEDMKGCVACELIVLVAALLQLSDASAFSSELFIR